jgi:tetratricopeptide (TPR) repeat protein
VASVAIGQDAADEEARRAFRVAQAHYENGDFDEAAAGFEEAYRLSRRPDLLYNVYLAHRDAQRTREAADALERYLNEAPDVGAHDRLRARLERMRAALAQESEATVDGASADGTNDVADDATDEVSGPNADRVDEGGSDLPVSALVVGGAGAALLIASAVTGLLTMSQQSELEDACPTRTGCDPGLEDTADGGKTLAVVTDVLWVTGLAAIGTATALLLWTDDEPSDAQAAGLGCDPGGCMGFLRMGL